MAGGALEYIKVILPLKLDWQPWYSAEAGSVSPGSRVKVSFAGRYYVAVVAEIHNAPDIDATKVMPVSEVDTELMPVSAEEIRLWNFLADYYMCTVGEVFKAAYPATRIAAEEKKARKKYSDVPEAPQKKSVLDAAGKSAVTKIYDAFASSKPVLLNGGADRREVLMEIIRRTLDSGRDVLFLEPAKPQAVTEFRSLARHFGDSALCPYSPDTVANRREIAKVLRSGVTPRVVSGGKNTVLLPFAHLGLVIVDDEQNPLYKQDSPAPCFNCRDVAVMLANIHRADVILVSSCPSLESLNNCDAGKFECVRLPLRDETHIRFIDVAAEARKKGMAGEWSFQLLKMLRDVSDSKGKALIVSPWEVDDTEVVPACARIVRPSGVDFSKLNKYSLVALIHAESLSSRFDFRSDERLLQFVSKVRESFDGTLAIQTKGRASLPDTVTLLNERKTFSLPPFSRIIDVIIKDTSVKRLEYMSRLLAGELSRGFRIQGMIQDTSSASAIIRICLDKDSSLSVRKRAMSDAVCSFERERKYSGHITFDVDPK